MAIDVHLLTHTNYICIEVYLFTYGVIYAKGLLLSVPSKALSMENH